MYRFLVLLLIVFSVCRSWAAEPTSTLRFAPLPLLSEHHVKEQFLYFCDALSHLTGQKACLVYKKDYRDILSALHHDELDLAYLGPMPYVIAHRDDQDIIPLVRFLNRNGDSHYTCALVVFGNERISDQATNKTIAMANPYSTCGYVVKNALLSTYDLNPKDLPDLYTGNHEQAALSVIRGESFFAGIKTSVARQYDNLGLTIVQQSEPLPGFVLVANQRTLGEEKIVQLQKALLQLSMHPTEKQKKCVEKWGEMIRYGMVEARDEDYASIRSLLTDLPEAEPAP